MCGKRLTAGVLARIEDLADRPAGFRPAGAPAFHNLVPLTEVLGEVLGVGAGSERVRGAWERLVRKVGSELSVLMEAPLEEIRRESPPLLDEALRRMRAGEVKTRAGYDGEYGVVRVFDESERRALLAQRSFGFALGAGTDEASAAVDKAGVRGAAPSDGSRPSADCDDAAAPFPLGAVALDPEQRAVVEHDAGPLLVIAGPGTGKTRAIIERIARMVRAGVSPRTIMAITFTRRAAGELRDRLLAALGDSGRSVGASTFHAFALELLHAFPEAAGLPAGFSVHDEAARAALGERVAASLGGRLRAGQALEAVSLAKATGVDVADELRPFFVAYQAALVEAGAVDFDDLVPRASALLTSSAPARVLVEQRCRHLFVDEYQDVNPTQDAFVRLLAPPGGRSGADDLSSGLCVVGDPDQAIYGFRGSDPGCFARFAADYPEARTVTLVRNYRCPGAVVQAATDVIGRTPGREPRALLAREARSPAIERFIVAGAAEEADLIATEIERAVGGTSLTSFDTGRVDNRGDGALAFHDVAILYRTSSQADALAEALDRATIPHRRVGLDPLLARPGVAPLIAALKGSLVATTDIATSIHAHLERSISDPVLARAAQMLIAFATPFGDDHRGFVDWLATAREIDLALEPQKVHLLTLHAAKGLEFPLVFIAGCEDGLIPFRFTTADSPEAARALEEERRLLYVGLTRAQRRLVLTAARRRTRQGRTLEPAPCPFLAHLAPELLVDHVAAARRARARQLTLEL